MRRTLDEAIRNLRNYISHDRILRKNSVESDFEQFCEGHCSDIETVLNALESLERIANGKKV